MKDITNNIANAINLMVERNLMPGTLPVIRNLEDNFVMVAFDVRTAGVADADVAEGIFCNPINPIDKGDFVIDPIVHLEGTVITVRFEVYDRRIDYVYAFNYEEGTGGKILLSDYASGREALADILKGVQSVDVEYGFCKKEA